MTHEQLNKTGQYLKGLSDQELTELVNDLEKAAFEENEKGSLQVGKSADFIILDQDLMKCKEDEILKTKVELTYINGERVYLKNYR